MFKKFGHSKEVFINQDEGMFVALPITLDAALHTLETYVESGRTYAKAGSVVKEGAVVRGILAEEYDITDGATPARVVLEGYCFASALTNAAFQAVSVLPKIVVIPYKKVILTLVSFENNTIILSIEGAKFTASPTKTNYTVSGATISTVTSNADGTLSLVLTGTSGNTASLTAIAAAEFIGATGSTLDGLPVSVVLK